MRLLRNPWTVCHLLVAPLLGCGPGGFASDGSSFGDRGTDAGTSDVDSSSDAPSTASATSTDPDPETDTSLGETDSSDSSDSWVEPETETETETGEPEPIDPPLCERTWTHVDTGMTHGHIGNTPIGGRPDGGFVSVNPVIGAGNDEVNVDAWFRSWSSTGTIEWEQLVNWDDLRDDPMVLMHDDLADLFTGGRVNANTQIEDAMVASLDGVTGELRWTFLRGDGGGYTSLVHNGAALLAAGRIGSFGAHALELIAFEPDTGAVLWSAAPELEFADVETRGLVMDGGVIEVLVAESSGSGALSILRFEPPSEAAELFVNLTSGSALAARGLVLFGANQLAALYNVDAASFLALVDRSDGQLLATLALDELGLAGKVAATELALTPEGLVLAGTLWDVDADRKTFVLRLDAELNPLCLGVMGKDELEGVFHSPELRGLSVGPTGELVTGSFVSNPRHSVFARWN